LSGDAGEERAYWAASAADYDLPHLRLRQVAAVLRGLGARRVVDLGCAGGHLRTLLPGVEYVGCDFVPLREPASFPFHQCDFNRQALPAQLHGLEAVVCSGILEYIDDLPGFLRRLHSRVVPGGHLVATYFNIEHISRVWAALTGAAPAGNPNWRSLRPPREIRRLLEDAGFVIAASIASGHSLRAARSARTTVSARFTLPPAGPWSRLLAQQFLFVAQRPARQA
jgi:SAM-dependent methyltransferase